MPAESQRVAFIRDSAFEAVALLAQGIYALARSEVEMNNG